jgi:hypothetical protein
VGLIVNEGTVARFILNRGVARSQPHDRTVDGNVQVVHGLGGLDWRIGRAAKRAPGAFDPLAWREPWSRTGSWAGMRYPVEAAIHLLAGLGSPTCRSVEWQVMERPTVGVEGSLRHPMNLSIESRTWFLFTVCAAHRTLPRLVTMPNLE